MNKRQAKVNACWRASAILQGALDEGWPDGDNEQTISESDSERLRDAMSDLIQELERRGCGH